MKSLSTLLVAALVGVVLLGGAISGAVAYRSSMIEIGELFDAKLAHSARVLHGLVDPGLDQADGNHPPAPLEIALWDGEVSGHGEDLETPLGHGYETRLAFQAFDPSGRLLLRSSNAPAVPISGLSPGFTDTTLDGVGWRAFVMRASSGRWYLAAERADVRADLAGDVTSGILTPLLIEVPITVALVFVVIGAGRRAMRRVTTQIRSRAADSLQPIDSSDVPEEIAGLVEALNGLLGRLDAALARERRFTADAAHELRTPIAGLQVNFSNLQAARGTEERVHAEAQLGRGLARLEHLVAQLLVLAQLEPGAAREAAVEVDLAAVCREVIAEFSDAGRLEAVALSLHAEQAAPVTAQPVEIGSLVRNLLDNALRHAGRPATVVLSVKPSAQGVELVIADSGPGIPEHDRARVLERFYRRLDSAATGSGLGLSIVRRVVDACDGRIDLGQSTRLGGLEVRIWLPRR